VFIVAQGLLMYLEPERVRQLFTSIADRFPGAEIVFDTVPRWFSHLTLLGLNQTAKYRLPPMPWGINRDEVEPTLHRWHPGVAGVAFLDYGAPRGLPRVLADMANHIPFARFGVPGLMHVTIANTGGQSFTPSVGVVKDIPSESGREEENLHLNGPTASRKPNMTTNSGEISSADTIGDVLTAAARNAMHGSDIAKATTEVIARRVALGMVAALDPVRADHIEFARMVQEKVEAFSTAGLAMLTQSGQAGQQVIRLASDEVMAAAHAMIEMTSCGSPAALAEAQSRFARAWFNRINSSFIAMGMLAVASEAAAMAPIHQTVVANAERIGR